MLFVKVMQMNTGASYVIPYC